MIKILSDNNSIFLRVEENGKLRDIELCVDKVRKHLNRSIEANARDANEPRAPETIVISRNNMAVNPNNVDFASECEDLHDGQNFDEDGQYQEVVAEIKLLSADREEIWNKLKMDDAPSLPELREKVSNFLPF